VQAVDVFSIFVDGAQLAAGLVLVRLGGLNLGHDALELVGVGAVGPHWLGLFRHGRLLSGWAARACGVLARLPRR
jgi:hypothetical protein